MFMENEIIRFMSKYLDLTVEEKKMILALDLIKKYKKGTILLEQGGTSVENYFVIKGILRYYYLVDGVEETTDFFSEGDVIEPNCVADRSPSKHYISCLEDCVLSVGTLALEKDIEEKFPRFDKICRLVAEASLKQSREVLYNYKLSTPQERYEHLSKTRPDLIQRVPQYIIASYLGIKPESLSRIRKRMIKN